MNRSCILVFCAAIIGGLAFSSPVIAQQKTVKACQEEWRADKAGNQAKGITEKAYVDKCRAVQPTAAPAASSAPKAAKPEPKAAKSEKSSSSATGQQKTVKACEEEWRADKAGNQAKGITEKAYVAKCRGGVSAPQPTAAPAAPPPAKEKTAAPAAPSAPAAPAPATRSTSPAAAPSGANQYVAEGQAKVRCPSDTVVWVNLSSKIYHFSGYGDYGHTKSGAYMCEKDANGQGMRAAKNEKHP